jgi:hypothetical protein
MQRMRVTLNAYRAAIGARRPVRVHAARQDGDSTGRVEEGPGVILAEYKPPMHATVGHGAGYSLGVKSMCLTNLILPPSFFTML